MEKMKDLKDLLTHEIQDLYSAEEQIIDALPAMIEKSQDAELKKALKEHLRITETQKSRLDEIRNMLKQNSGNDDAAQRHDQEGQQPKNHQGGIRKNNQSGGTGDGTSTSA